MSGSNQLIIFKKYSKAMETVYLEVYTNVSKI